MLLVGLLLQAQPLATLSVRADNQRWRSKCFATCTWTAVVTITPVLHIHAVNTTPTIWHRLAAQHESKAVDTAPMWRNDTAVQQQ
jgi:hypothetical protein